RSQVVRDEQVASQGGQLTWYLDGAHTPESLAACAAWLRGELATAAAATTTTAATTASTDAPATRHALVLLFNCMRDRDPAVLLPPLASALLAPPSSPELKAAAVTAAVTPTKQPAASSGAQARPSVQASIAIGVKSGMGDAGPAVGGVVQLQAAIFTPMLSGGGVLLPPGQGSQQQQQQQQQEQQPAVDLSWQVRMRDVWYAVSPHAGATSQGSVPEMDGMAVYTPVGLAKDGGGACTIPDLPYVSVASSLPDALAAVRTAAVNDPRVHLHVLVTGSLYLVGDVLRLLDKRPA
ncbi:hypothetical protein Agub_g14012, partial [Astrephomene gubernaculifera]